MDNLDDRWIECLSLSSFEALDNAERSECTSCNSKRMYYCYDCFIPLTEYHPIVDLPMKVIVLRSDKEPRSKSSIVPLKIVCPQAIV